MSKTVLVVDDEPANIDLVKGLLSDRFKCKAAISGQIALKQIARQVPDLLVLDLVMPVMNGIETLMEIRKEKDNESLPVLIVSGTREEKDVDVLEGLGISGFITKPIDASEFQFQIQKLLGDG